MSTLHDTLPDLMREATADLDAPRPDLVATSMARGSRLRLRRNVTRGLGGVAGVAMVAGAIATPGLLGRGAAVTPAASGVGVTAPAVNPPAKAATVPVQTVLQQVLAGRGAFSDVSGEAFGHGGAHARLVLDDGAGRAEVSVYVEHTRELIAAWGSETAKVLWPTSCADPGLGGSTCAQLTDGTVVTTFTGPEYTGARDQGVIQVSATIYRADGLTVSLTDSNAPTEKGTAKTRANAPLSGADLIALGQRPEWASAKVAEIGPKPASVPKPSGRGKVTTNVPSVAQPPANGTSTQG